MEKSTLGPRYARWFLAAGTAGILILAAGPLTAGQPPPGIEVYPPGSPVEGQGMAAWSVKWWQWALSFPKDSSPLLDSTGAACADGQVDPMFFLGADVDPPQAVVSLERVKCSVPAGPSILFPILTSIKLWPKSEAAHCEECDEDSGFLDAVKLYLKVDGMWIEDLDGYRERSEGCFDVTLPENNLKGLPAGDYTACAAGYWIALEPPHPGRHLIEYHGVQGDPNDPTVDASITFFFQVGEIPPPPGFRRGDANGDTQIDITDAVFILKWLFQAGQPPACPDSADAQDDGGIDLSDPLYLIYFQFIDGPPPPAPFENCGEDTTGDGLGDCFGACPPPPGPASSP